ncbi:hypothetical protein ABK040_001451 [Willaertia magna]
MKFGKRLRDEMTPEWRLSYMDYKLLKKLIKKVQGKLEERYHIDYQMIQNEVPPSEIGVPIDYLTEPLTKFSEDQVYASTGKTDDKDEYNFIDILEEHNIEGMYLRIVPKETCQFFNRLEKELDKVNKFYRATEKKFGVRHAELLVQLNMGLTTALSKSDKQKIRNAFQEHYRALLLLLNFRSLNFQGFSNILKKLDKYTKSRTKNKLLKRVRESYFYNSKVLDYMMNQIEYKVSIYMFKGDIKKAKNFLRLPQAIEQQTSPFRSGIAVGMGVILSLVFVFTYVVLYPRSDPPPFSDATMYSYRIAFMPIILAVLVGVNMKIWQNARINYVFIFQFNPRNHLSVSQYLEVTMMLYNISMGSLIIYMFCVITKTFFEYAYLIPVFFFIFLFVCLFFPYNWFYGASRLWFFKEMLRLIFAPFRRVDFADFWLADQLTSLSDFLFEIQFVYCVYPSLFSKSQENFCSDSASIVSIPFLNILPNYIRFMQCVRRFRDSNKPHPHLTNAFKYLSSIIATIIAFLDKNIVSPTRPGSSWNYMRTTWVITNLVSSSYKLFWDLRMDWSLVQFDKEAEHKLLRKELFFHPNFYYFSMITNLLARYFWLFVLLLKQFYGSYLTDQWIGFVFGLVEVLRRFQWNCIRLENEHLNNVGEFRATNEIPLPFEISKMEGHIDEKKLTGTDKFIHYIFFLCNLKKDLGDSDDDKVSVSETTASTASKLKTKTVLSKGLSELTDGLADDDVIIHDDDEHELKEIKILSGDETNVLGSNNNNNGLPLSNNMNKDFSTPIDSNRDASNSNNLTNSNNTKQKTTTVVLGEEDENEDDHIVITTRNRGNSILKKPISPIDKGDYTSPYLKSGSLKVQTNGFSSSANVANSTTSSTYSPSISLLRAINTKDVSSKDTPTPLTGLHHMATMFSEETKNNNEENIPPPIQTQHSSKVKQTIVTIEDDEEPSTPAFLTNIYKKKNNPFSSALEKDSSELKKDEKKNESSGNSSKKEDKKSQEKKENDNNNFFDEYGNNNV